MRAPASGLNGRTRGVRVTNVAAAKDLPTLALARFVEDVRAVAPPPRSGVRRRAASRRQNDPRFSSARGRAHGGRVGRGPRNAREIQERDRHRSDGHSSVQARLVGSAARRGSERAHGSFRWRTCGAARGASSAVTFKVTDLAWQSSPGSPPKWSRGERQAGQSRTNEQRIRESEKKAEFNAKARRRRDAKTRRRRTKI